MNSQAVRVAAGLTAFLRKHRQTSLLPEIIGILQHQAESECPGTLVESVIGLTAETKREIEQTLRQNLGVNGTIGYIVNPDLLAGIRITSSDRTIDLSVKGRIERIYEQV